MMDEQRMETKKQIVERTKELIAERFGQDHVRFSRGNMPPMQTPMELLKADPTKRCSGTSAFPRPASASLSASKRWWLPLH